ncbi:aldehyde ferredoxin oxidoreductase C-terminal domain-containing protein [Chloroflexota bacterium]
MTIKDTQHLWGKNTWEIEKLIREELGDRDIRTMCIGQAGENLVKYTCPIPDDESVPAETGVGAVMGYKKLKAVAVSGSQSVKVADPERYEEIIRKWYEDIPKRKMTATRRSIGTTYLVKSFNDLYTLAIKNAQEVHCPEEEISHFYGENFVPKYLVRHFACFSCPLPCQKFVLIHDGAYAGEKGRRPEFGPLISLCTHLAVFDFPFGLKVTNMLNQYGIDAQEIGPTMAMAFECYQRGILTRKDIDGLRLEWGDKTTILELIRKVAYREGFGDVLADGCLNATRRIGRGAEKYAYLD